MILKHLHSIFTSLLWSKKFKNALFLEGYQHSPSVSTMTENKKCRQKSKQIEATKDVSVEFSEDNLGMSGENTPSNDETEFIGKENENNLMPSFNIFELLETPTFVELEEL